MKQDLQISGHLMKLILLSLILYVDVSYSFSLSAGVGMTPFAIMLITTMFYFLSKQKRSVIFLISGLFIFYQHAFDNEPFKEESYKWRDPFVVSDAKEYKEHLKQTDIFSRKPVTLLNSPAYNKNSGVYFLDAISSSDTYLVSTNSHVSKGMGEILETNYYDGTMSDFINSIPKKHLDVYKQHDNTFNILVLMDDKTPSQRGYNDKAFDDVIFFTDLFYEDVIKKIKTHSHVSFYVLYEGSHSKNEIYESINFLLAKNNIIDSFIGDHDDFDYGLMEIPLFNIFDLNNNREKPRFNLMSDSYIEDLCGTNIPVAVFSRYPKCENEIDLSGLPKIHTQIDEKLLTSLFNNKYVFLHAESNADLDSGKRVDQILEKNGYIVIGTLAKKDKTLLDSLFISLIKLNIETKKIYSILTIVIFLLISLYSARKHHFLISSIASSISYIAISFILLCLNISLELSLVFLVVISLFYYRKTFRISRKTDSLNYLESVGLKTPQIVKNNRFKDLDGSIRIIARSNYKDECESTKNSGKYESKVIDSIDDLNSLKFTKNYFLQEFIDADQYGVAIINCQMDGELGAYVEHSDKHSLITDGKDCKYSEFISSNSFDFIKDDITRDLAILMNDYPSSASVEFCIKDNTVYWLQLTPIYQASHSQLNANDLTHGDIVQYQNKDDALIASYLITKYIDKNAVSALGSSVIFKNSHKINAIKGLLDYIPDSFIYYLLRSKINFSLRLLTILNFRSDSIKSKKFIEPESKYLRMMRVSNSIKHASLRNACKQLSHSRLYTKFNEVMSIEDIRINHDNCNLTKEAVVVDLNYSSKNDLEEIRNLAQINNRKICISVSSISDDLIDLADYLSTVLVIDNIPMNCHALVALRSYGVKVVKH